MLINLTNHPSASWSKEQMDEASVFGEILDVPFPNVDASKGEDYIEVLANDYFLKIKSYMGDDDDFVVHIMGEMTFTYALVSMLKKEKIVCIASTTERIVVEKNNGKKEVEFKFSRFRRY